MAFHERKLRKDAENNSKMTYLNINVKGLNGLCHPAMKNICNTSEVRKLHAHVKMLCNDLYTYEVRARYTGGSATCRLCLDSGHPCLRPIENICHILTSCSAYSEIRARIFLQYEIICASSMSKFNFTSVSGDPELTSQFILDCTSLNLPIRISESDEICPRIFSLSRDLCYSIYKRRLNLLRNVVDPDS